MVIKSIKQLVLESISEKFTNKVKDKPYKVVYKTPFFKSGRARNEVRERLGYYYWHRFGGGSIAFILWDGTNFITLKQFSTSNNQYVIGAFTGSLDKPELSPEEITMEEVREETGYEVSLKDIYFIGNYFVGSQTDEICYLYLINIQDKKKLPIKPESDWEKNTEFITLTYQDILRLKDWKAIVIATISKERNLLT